MFIHLSLRFMPLSLSISQRLIQAHDARINVLSELVHGRGLDHNQTRFMASGNIYLHFLNRSTHHEYTDLTPPCFFQEKSYVTGLEAANRVVDYLEEVGFAKIIPVEEDEPHIQALRSLNRNLNDVRAQLPWSDYFLP